MGEIISKNTLEGGHMAHKRSPVRNCVSCLYRIGFGIQRIAPVVGKSKALCFKWVRQMGVLEAGRTKLGQKRQSKIAVEITLPNRLIMEEYRKELRAVSKPDRAWFRHPKLEIIRSTQRQRARRLRDPAYKARRNARKRVGQFLRDSALKKTFSISTFMGCDNATLKTHIERQFKRGMTWENHGKVWHLDHKTPLASASTIEQVKALSHYTNLQPLFASENQIKRDKIYPHQPELCIDMSRTQGKRQR